MYLIRLKLGQRYGTRYGTIEHDDLRASFKRKTRRAKHQPAGFRRVGFVLAEDAGVDKSIINLRFTNEDIISDKGSRGLSPGNTTFKLLERHQHIRELSEDDASILLRYDREIEAKQQELNAIREARKAAVAEAWTRADKIGISELEERAGKNNAI